MWHSGSKRNILLNKVPKVGSELKCQLVNLFTRQLVYLLTHLPVYSFAAFSIQFQSSSEVFCHEKSFLLILPLSISCCRRFSSL